MPHANGVSRVTRSEKNPARGGRRRTANEWTNVLKDT